MNSDDEDMMAKFLEDAERLQGLTLEQLGYLPHPDEMPEEDRAGLDAEDLEYYSSLPADERRRSLQQAKLLAGVLWQASSILIDELFEDLDNLDELETITPDDIRETTILSMLPRRFSVFYDIGFGRRFLITAADVTGCLVRRWDSPGCVAGELALRCLLDKAEALEELYDLDLADDWRAQIEQVCLEDTDSEMLYDLSLDGFEDDDASNAELGVARMRFEDWFRPFNTGYAVPPYAAD